MPEPPKDLGPVGRAIWHSAHASAVSAGIWRAPFVVGLEQFARAAELYVTVARAVGGDDVGVRGMHRNVRKWLFDWYLVKAPYPSAIRPDGIDADVGRLCGLPEGGVDHT